MQDFFKGSPRPISTARVRRGNQAQQSPFFRGIQMFGVVGAGFLLAIGILFSGSHWNGKDQRAFIVLSPAEQKKDSVLYTVSVVMVRGSDSQAVLLTLPNTLYLETLRGYGMYKTSSLYGLTGLEHLPNSFLLQTLSVSLGIHIQDIMMTNTYSEQINLSLLRTLFFQSLLFKSSSSFGYVDRYRMWKLLLSLRSDQFSRIDPISSKLVSSRQGEGQSYMLNVPVFDTLVFQLFADPNIRKEHVSVSIVNTTNLSGLGTRLARAFSSMGINVIHISTEKTSLNQSKIFFSNQEIRSSTSIQTLVDVLVLPKDRLEKQEEKTREYRADAVLLIGEDIADIFQE